MRNGLGALETVLLLGGTSEIGLAAVKALARDGRLKTAWLAGRDGDRLDAAAGSLGHELGIEVRKLHFDALQPGDHDDVLKQAFAAGPIDCVISAFGSLGAGIDFVEDRAAAARLLQTNYVAAVLSGLTVVDHLKRQGFGTLVVISSVAAERARADTYLYASTKAGLDAWACGLADSLVGSGVRILVVRPGFVYSKMTAGLPAAPLATTPEVVGEAVGEAVRRGRELIWVPAKVRPLMSAVRHLPRPVFRAVAKRSG